MRLIRRAVVASMTLALFAGLVHPATAAPVQASATAEDPPPRPMPPDPYKEWDGKTGVPDTGDPRMRDLVADIAELDEDVEVRDAAKDALAKGTPGIKAFIPGGQNTARQQAKERKELEDKNNRTTIEALRGRSGPYLQAEVERVLAADPLARKQFVIYGKAIAEQRDAATVQSAKDRAAQNRARVQMLVTVGGPEIRRTAKAALDAGDAAIEQYLAKGYLEAAKTDAATREQFIKDEEDRQRAAEALSDLAKRSARANEARKILMVEHGNGIRALQRSANAMILAGNEARKAEQILAANNASGQHPLDAFNGVKAEVARQLSNAKSAASDANIAAGKAKVQADVLVEVQLPYGTQWAQMAYGMAQAAKAATSAVETASHSTDAAAYTDQAKNAQEKAERHAEQAKKWGAHAKAHADAAANLADAARVQMDAAKDAAARTKTARQAAEQARDEAWAGAKRTREQRLEAEKQAGIAAEQRKIAERERANAAQHRQTAEQQAAVAHSMRGEAERQAGIAYNALQGALTAEGAANTALSNAITEDGKASAARDKAYALEREQRAAEAKVAALDAAVAAAKTNDEKNAAQSAANQARGEANTAASAAASARNAANIATGAAAAARGAATEATRAAARARAAAQAAEAAAKNADLAASRAESEAAATHHAAQRANAAATEATHQEARASEAAQSAVSLANQAANEAMQSLMAADRTKAESEAAAQEAVSAATQASLAVQASTAAKASSAATIEPANTAITVVAPFTGQDIDADFVILVAEQAKKVGAEQAAAANTFANQALEAAKAARKAANEAKDEVKPAYEAAAKAAESAADAARSAAEAQKAAAEAAADGAAAREAAASANQADAQAREDARIARQAANQAANDAALAGKSAAAAEKDASAAREAATQAEIDASAAREAATKAEGYAALAKTAADNAQAAADAAAKLAEHAYEQAVDAGKAADRAEEQARQAEIQKRKQEASDDDGEQQISVEDEEILFMEGGPDSLNEYNNAFSRAKNGVLDYLKANGAEILLDLIGYTDAKKCFTEGDVAACLWTVLNAGSLVVMVAKLPAVTAAIAKVVAGMTKFLEGSAIGRKILAATRKLIKNAKYDCVKKVAAAPLAGGKDEICEAGETPVPKKTREIEIATSSWENARNQALDKLGEIDQATRVPYVGRMETAQSTFGKVCGFETRVNGVHKRFRLDYDPVKGPHINVTVGKGNTGQKWAIKWPGTMAEFETILKGNI
nr:hypothetical protein [Kibdelosporangium sp. MJ126-NF4]CEL19198.1 Hypothetical protein [Kibdelosporangium sp. MJ126-NF4]CTQ95002.1 Hypothetical protein [Kibdelosporangium sp. MJ126-NF4]